MNEQLEVLEKLNRRKAAVETAVSALKRLKKRVVAGNVSDEEATATINRLDPRLKAKRA